MSTGNSGTKNAHLERVRFFPRQLVTADDLNAAVEYFDEKLCRHNRFMHGWGVVCGCEVTAKGTSEKPWQIHIAPGYLITPQGHEIEIPDELPDHGVNFDLGGNWYQAYDPCQQPPSYSLREAPAADTVQYVAVCYAECETRPVRVHPAGCGCDETACEYSRVRESFEIDRLSKLPDSREKLDTALDDLHGKISKWVPQRGADPIPSYFPPVDDDYVVLAKITITKEGTMGFEDLRQICSPPHLPIELVRMARSSSSKPKR